MKIPEETQRGRMKTMKIVGVAVVVGMLSACHAARSSLSGGVVRDTWGQVSDKNTIRVRGIGAAPEGVKDLTRRRGRARNAALVAGRYEMLALLKGVMVRGGVNVGGLMEKDSHIREVADRIISGAEEVATEWAKDDGCVVTLEIDRVKVEKMLADTGAYESPEASARSLDAQAALSDARTSEQRAQLPGMGAQ